METGKQTAFWGAVGTVGAAVVLWVITPVGEYVEGGVRSYLASQFGDPGNSGDEDASARAASGTGPDESRAPTVPVSGSAEIVVDARGTGDKSTELAASISTAVAAKLERSSVVERIEYVVGRQSSTSPRTAAIGLVLYSGSSEMDCGGQNTVFRSSAELATKIAERANRALAKSREGETLVCS